MKAPWPDLRQVEQDLIISRALCDLFNAPELAGKIAFRGGTAIHKLLFKRPLRYSEDIDLVQAHPEPIGGTVDTIRAALSWLGRCSREQAGHSMHLVFKFTPEVDAQVRLKLKVEINTREHASLLGVRRYSFTVENDWYHGKAEIASFEPEELFGTKLRALLQRRRNRDLFDLHQGLEQLSLAPEKVIACFDHYLALEDKPISRAMAEQRMLEKLTRSLTEDVAPMLPAGVRWSDADAIQAFERVWAELITRISGDGWKLSDAVIEELRTSRYPALLMPRDRQRPQ
jgi:predicted nucleotidyltransferase component of viral defense system